MVSCVRLAGLAAACALITARATADQPCCQLNACKDAGLEKYWSIAKSLFGTPHCGECCMDPKKYNLFHFFESNLTHSDSDSPCQEFGYTKYDSTVTHGFGPVSMALDLYDLPKEEVKLTAAEPCCQNSCKGVGMEKYWSIAKSVFGTSHCGECCMDPKKYNLFHFFESNLTHSDSDSPCQEFGYTKYDSTVTHGFGPVSMTLDLYDLPREEKKLTAAEPCCQNACKGAGLEKYWSIAKSIFGTPHCGECCMDPKKYNLFHFFESNLTHSDSDSPCEEFGYTKYDSTVTHGFGPVSMTLDLYDLPKDEVKLSGAEPCCQNACKEAGLEKYWSIAKSVLGTPHCGECCMDPKKYNLFHFFESNLTHSDSDTPCQEFGYTKYDSTVTHGFGPVSMTLDLYDLPESPILRDAVVV